MSPNFSKKLYILTVVRKLLRVVDDSVLQLLLLLEIKKGQVGFGYGKAQMVPDAIRKGTEQAKKAMKTVSISGETIPHPILGTYDGGKVFCVPQGGEQELLQEVA